MRTAYCFTAALMFCSVSALAADPVQVIELQVDEGATNRSTANSGSSRNDSAMLLYQLQDEVRTLRGMVEQQQYQLQQMERQQRDRYRDLDRRIAAGLGGTASSQTSSAPSLGSSTMSGLTPLPAADSTPTDAQAYQQAFDLVRKKDFPAALNAFDQFIARYPDSVRLPNAYYWVGEVNLAEQKLAPAKAAFEKVLNTFPEQRKAADASYKLGVIYHQMGDQVKANEMFTNTISRYPDSSAANLARDYLKR